jgi:transcription initiation factor TFIID TATA-box-binding protein
MMRIRIENVVASASMGGALDLTKIAVALEEAEYAPDQFPGLIYRLKDPKTAILLFRSGKAVCTGGRSWKQLDDSITKVSAMIRAGGQEVAVHPKIQIQNIVATSNLDSELNLASIAVTLGLDRVEYEPEQFPGLVCRMEDPHVVMLLFSSGKLVCTGARRPAELAVAVEKMTAELEKAGLLDHVHRRATFLADQAAARSKRPATDVAAAPPNLARVDRAFAVPPAVVA